MGILTEAMCFAVDAHGEERRKGDGTPMVLHAMEAAAIAATLTGDDEVIAAAVLHDTVEDAHVKPEEIESRFGQRVAWLVSVETEDKHRDQPAAKTWRARKEETLARLGASPDRAVAIVVLSDKLSNMRSFYRGVCVQGNAFFDRFNQKDPQAHHWYYRAIADALSQLADTPAWREYDFLIKRVFGEKPEGQRD